MTDTKEKSTAENNQAAESQQATPGFAIQKIYLKDLSFETPSGPAIFGENWKPSVHQDLNIQVNQLQDSLFEVVLLITVSASAENKAVFIIEVKQGGIFTIEGIEGIQLSHAINTLCPQILFPYVREIIDSTLVRGGFPPMALAPLNFDAIFAQAMVAAQQQESEKAKGDKSDASIQAPSSETLN